MSITWTAYVAASRAALARTQILFTEGWVGLIEICFNLLFVHYFPIFYFMLPSANNYSSDMYVIYSFFIWIMYSLLAISWIIRYIWIPINVITLSRNWFVCIRWAWLMGYLKALEPYTRRKECRKTGLKYIAAHAHQEKYQHQQCPICLESFNEMDQNDPQSIIMILQCGHIYCNGCLLQNEMHKRQSIGCTTIYPCAQCNRTYYYNLGKWKYDKDWRKRFFTMYHCWDIWEASVSSMFPLIVGVIIAHNI